MVQDIFIGSMINNYEVLSRIGRGGMGDVYLAKHPQIGKKVAIKILRPDSPKTLEVTQRFFHEAMVVNKIHHRNIVDVLDFGAGEGAVIGAELINCAGKEPASQVTPSNATRASVVIGGTRPCRGRRCGG